VLSFDRPRFSFFLQPSRFAGRIFGQATGGFDSPLVFPGYILDFFYDGLDVSVSLAAFEATRQTGFGRKLIFLKEGPHFFAVFQIPEFWRKTAQKGLKIAHVTNQDLSSLGIARGIDSLREIDDYGPVWIDQNVEVGQITVNDTCAEHFGGFMNQVDQ
jgi:hypothetical protein